MKAIIFALLFAASSAATHAQNKNSEFDVLSKDVICAPMSVIVDLLRDSRVNEKPIWIGKEEDKSNIVLLINARTSAWTVIQYHKQYACVLGIGDQSEIIIPKK